jgi:hypothetical protein
MHRDQGRAGRVSHVAGVERREGVSGHHILENIPNDTPLWPVRVVSSMTGVGGRILRDWEKSYGLIVPARSKGGHRLYSVNDIKRIKRIKAYRDQGVALQALRTLVNGAKPRGKR